LQQKAKFEKQKFKICGVGGMGGQVLNLFQALDEWIT
jgi:hypothetical protein